MRTYGVPKTILVGTYYEVHKNHQRYIRHQRPSWRKRIWDKANSQILRRTPRSWGMILLAYFIFYIVCLTFTVIYWVIFHSTVSVELPRMLMDQPGFMFEPICEYINKKRQYIEYNPQHSGEVNCYVERIKSFLEKYGKKKDFGACTAANHYGYDDKTPCIFLKINRAVGFKLQPIEQARDLPKAAPKELKAYLNSLPASERKLRLWTSCAAVKQTSLTIKYFPQRYINASELEMESGDAESSSKYSATDFKRITAVQFSNLPLNQNVKIKCNIWAKNIKRDSSASVGPAQGFLLLVIKIKT